jgi:hypothetical protein
MAKFYVSATQTIESDDANDRMITSGGILFNGDIIFYEDSTVSGASITYNVIPKTMNFLIANENGGFIDNAGYNNP